MKKFASAILAGTMALSMCSTVVFAEGVKTGDNISVTNDGTFTFNKEYKVTNGTAPAQTFSFNVACTGVTGASKYTSTSGVPTPTVSPVSFEASISTVTKAVTVDLPAYDSVGVYTYSVTESGANAAGVSMNGPMTLTVTVTNGDNGSFNVVVNMKDSNGHKVDGFTGDTNSNEYKAGELDVTKTVTGAFGEKNREFTIDVTFTNTNDFAVTTPIVDDKDADDVTLGAGAQQIVHVTLKHGETVHFTNVPAGVRYTVSETAPDGYDTPSISGGDGVISGTETDSVTVTNSKGGDIVTGVFTDNMPYILMVTLVGAGVLLVVRRRAED